MVTCGALILPSPWTCLPTWMFLPSSLFRPYPLRGTTDKRLPCHLVLASTLPFLLTTPWRPISFLSPFSCVTTPHAPPDPPESRNSPQNPTRQPKNPTAKLAAALSSILSHSSKSLTLRLHSSPIRLLQTSCVDISIEYATRIGQEIRGTHQRENLPTFTPSKHPSTSRVVAWQA